MCSSILIPYGPPRLSKHCALRRRDLCNRAFRRLRVPALLVQRRARPVSGVQIAGQRHIGKHEVEVKLCSQFAVV